ncbi:unnamed protein product [Rhizophagus irregularis]|uniref:Protein kinase domain-containing protein n=1 Tax=Rhizophagus irregularis TaxID=588596 RepID=A0A916EK33_9GLOM|nr:unnamed protein product [Rhizophagus irregularis]
MDRTVPKRSSSMPSGSPPAANLLDDHIFSSNVEDYDINANSPIGYGASAIVYGAVYKPLNKKVAVKMIDLDFFERNQIDEVRRETQLMSLSKHANVLRVYGSFVNESKLFIVTPYMSAGSCSDIMKTAHPDGFEENIIATILKQALQGLDYLHKNGHIHRDVKAGNLLVDKDGSVLLADFGVSSSLTENGDRKGIRRTFVGTPCWMAPEVMEHAGYDYKADIWSFGITSLELATGNAPFAKYPPLKVIMVTLSKEPPTLDRESTKHKYTKTFKDMIDMCLHKDPTKRPSAEKLLSHPFYRVAKRKDYLVSKILQHLPPLEERPHKRVQQKPITYTKGVTWDFAVDSEHRDNDDQENSILQANEGKPEGKRVEFSDTNDNTDTKSDSSAVTNVPPKKSRFLVGDAATESKVPLSLSVPTISSTVSVTPQSPLSRSQPPSAGTNFVSNPLSPGEKDEQNAQRLQPQQSQEIRKGRFSVIESNGSKEKTSSSGSQHESDNNQRPPISKERSNEKLTENYKKSRFEVQHSPDMSIISSSVFQNISRENTVHSPISLSRESTLSKGDTSFSREGTINRSNGGSLDAQTTEKPMGTKKGRFQVSIDVPPKMDGSISPSGNLLTAETTFSPQSTFLGHSPNISPSSSILRGQGQHMMSSANYPKYNSEKTEKTSSLLTTLLQQNEIQRAILNEIIVSNGNHFTSAVAGRIHSQQIPNVNGNTGIRSSPKEISSYLSILDRQFQYISRDNDELRKENEILRRENESLRKENGKLKKLTTLNSTSINDSIFIPENLTVNSISTTSSSTKSTSLFIREGD